MERREAERVFALVADLQGDLQDRLVHERWWLIWILMGVEMLVTCSVTHWLFLRGERRLWVFVVVWAIHIALIPLVIFLVQRRAGGQRTRLERNIWWIWTTFIVCSCSTALMNSVIGLELFRAAPVVSLLAAFAFSMMGMVAHRAFALPAFLFLAVMVVMGLFPMMQFLVYGIAWFVTLLLLGLYYRPRGPVASRAL